MEESQVAIIGAGVIGLSLAHGLCRDSSGIVVIEKNDSFGQETSSRNSEVIHAGLYYVPGSLKALTCIRGKNLLYEFCRRFNIAHRKTGKLLIACDREEERRVREIYENACSCGIENSRFLTTEEIKALEPDIAVQAGFFTPDSGILDTHGFMRALYRKALENGVSFAFSSTVIGIERRKDHYLVSVREPSAEIFTFKTKLLINAAGLQADAVCRLAGFDTGACGYDIHFCRGQYFRIGSPRKFAIDHLVYPPATGVSLGIHITPDLAGGLRLGPDEKYIPEIDYRFDESAQNFFYEAVKKFLPALAREDLIPDTVGVRPKLQAEGEGFRDFVITDEAARGFAGFINCLGIESPGFTACLAIAEEVKKITARYLS